MTVQTVVGTGVGTGVTAIDTRNERITTECWKLLLAAFQPVGTADGTLGQSEQEGIM